MTTLADLGAVLFGEHWQSPMARALGVNLRTVQRWAAGDHPVPARITEELTGQLRQHHARIAVLLDGDPDPAASRAAHRQAVQLRNRVEASRGEDMETQAGRARPRRDDEIS